MSIFKKIFLLFCASIGLMYYLSMQTNKINNAKIEAIYKQKYIQSSKELFRYLVDGDIIKIKKKIKELGYKIVNLDIKNTQMIYDKKLSFGEVKIIKKDDRYFLYIKYLDDSFIFFDSSQILENEQKKMINYLIIADILLLVVMFLVIIRLLKPIKDLSYAIEQFGKGKYSKRIKERKNNDEISKLIKEFNQMAQNLDNLIKSRTILLRDISHELRTPISKMKLSVEMIKDDKYANILRKAINQMDNLTNELLQIEKLNADTINLQTQTVSIETILSEALSKLIIENENNISIEIRELFICKADINYISIAIKNLIDNAIKYSSNQKVSINIYKHTLEISNPGVKLKKELDFYLQTFTQEDYSRKDNGYGLGLNIVHRILQLHGFRLNYIYKNGCNIFQVLF